MELHAYTPLLPIAVPSLANGNFGYQNEPLGLAGSPMFAVGIVDDTPGDIRRAARLPDTQTIEIWLAGQPLHNAATDRLTDYVQSLDVDRAVLTTRWTVDAAGQRLAVETQRRVLQHDKRLALLSVRLVAATLCELTVRVPLVAHPEPRRFDFRVRHDVPPGYGGGSREQRTRFRWHPGHATIDQLAISVTDRAIGVRATAKHSHSVGLAMALADASEGEARWLMMEAEAESQAALAAFTCERSLQAGQEWRFDVFAGLERDADSSQLACRARRCAIQARDQGPRSHIAQHEQAWSDLWQADVVLEGDAALAQQARVDLFNLLQAAGEDDRWAWPVGGIASTVYNGGVFWDCDLFQFPALLPLQPQKCRGVVGFRQRIVDTATQRARDEGWAGIKYAWESDLLTGLENHAPNDHDMPRGEVHVNAAVAIAQWWYYCATGDRSWLATHALPVIRGVADLFASMAKPLSDQPEHLGLHGIWCVCESEGLVDCCTYTTAAARVILQLADYACCITEQPSNPAWLNIARRLALPQREGKVIGHRHASGPLAWTQTLLVYPLEWPFEPAEIQRDLAKPQTWDMSFQAIQAAAAGDRLAMRRYIDHQACASPIAPFGVRPEAPGRDAVPFHTGCGAHLQAWLYGATGMRWREAGLVPVVGACLPEGIHRVAFPRLTWHGHKYRVEVTSRAGLTVESLP